MLLKYFYDQKLAHASYLVGCQQTGEALIVDPGRDVDIYLRAVVASDMRISGITETHIHADFVSGARELAERTGARLYLSNEGDENWKYSYLDAYDHVLLKDGDCFMIGNVRMEVIHTPGHTPEHISLVLTDTAGADRPMGIFTGDFVFVGSVGRPDLLEKAAGFADTAVAGARQLFQSLERFKQLSDYLQVWPAHGAGSACGKGLGAVPSSTVGYEKLFNPALAYDDEEAFVEFLLADQPEPPKYFAIMKQVNKEGPPVLDRLPTPLRLPAERLPALIETDAMVVDTRPANSFAARHVPGTINIPLRSLPEWAGWLVDYERPLYLIVDSSQAAEAVRDLVYIGIDKVTAYFEPSAIDTLAESGHTLQSYEIIAAEEVAGRILKGEVSVVDVRAQSEWYAGHLPNAVHVMLGYLPEHSGKLIDGRPIAVLCRTGRRSAIGASILQASGATKVINVAGGIRDWAAAGLPIVMRDDFAPGQVARARHHTYLLLGRLFVEGVNDESLPYVRAIPELASVLPDMPDMDEAAADYQHLFGFNLFPYESIFLDTTGLLGGAISEAVRRNYERAGYAVNMVATSADHIGPELSFLAFLAGGEADAWEDSSAAVARQMERQRDFLQEHLLGWLPPLVLAVRQQGQTFFTALADLTLAFVHSHYVSLRSPAAIDFRLSAPPTLLDNEKTGLKEIASYLATPLYSGIYLSRDDVGHLARQLRLPRGFAGREQMLVNLMRAAVQYDALPALLAELQSLTGSWRKAYADLASAYPELRPWATAWQERTGNTVQLLSQIEATVSCAAA